MKIILRFFVLSLLFLVTRTQAADLVREVQAAPFESQKRRFQKRRSRGKAFYRIVKELYLLERDSKGMRRRAIDLPPDGVLVWSDGPYHLVKIGDILRINAFGTYDQDRPDVLCLDLTTIKPFCVSAWRIDWLGQKDVFLRTFDPYFNFDTWFDYIAHQFVGDQQHPTITECGWGDGYFCIAYFTDNGVTSYNRIYIRKFNINSNTAPQEIQFSNPTLVDQRDPSLASPVNGTLLMGCWREIPENGPEYVWKILCKGKYFNFTDVGPQFYLDNRTGTQINVQLRKIPGVGVGAIYQSTHFGNYQIFFNIYDDALNPLLTNFKVSNHLTNIYTSPNFASQNNIIVMVYDANNNSNYNVFKKKYIWQNNALSLMEDETQVNDVSVDQEHAPGIDVISNRDAYLITFNRLQGTNYNIDAKLFKLSSNQQLGNQTIVSPGDVNDYSSSVISDAGEGCAIINFKERKVGGDEDIKGVKYCVLLDPTMEPTKYPSQYPTMLPTAYPTKIPSKFPSQGPTNYPSYIPTLYPTVLTTFPTNYPTSFTLVPTNHPSLKTLFPSNTPTQLPTILTFSPTGQPTLYTLIPTNHPSLKTLSPTFYPSLYPTIFTHPPSNTPTSYTLIPTNHPSLKTLFPSNIPTQFPTIFTTSPSNSPTSYTLIPTNHPSLKTLFPSNIPTQFPTIFTTSPSNSPTSYTLIPTNHPSLKTLFPSHIPTQFPTIFTTSPSNSPTSYTLIPTNHPSLKTLFPSHIPTQFPTIFTQYPSNLPTSFSLAPTYQPSPKTPIPTVEPTNQPTVEPTYGPTVNSPQPTVMPTKAPLSQTTTLLPYNTTANVTSFILYNTTANISSTLYNASNRTGETLYNITTTDITNNTSITLEITTQLPTITGSSSSESAEEAIVDPSKPTDAPLSGGAITGIVFGSLAGVCCLFLFFWLIYKLIKRCKTSKVDRDNLMRNISKTPKKYFEISS